MAYVCLCDAGERVCQSTLVLVPAVPFNSTSGHFTVSGGLCNNSHAILHRRANIARAIPSPPCLSAFLSSATAGASTPFPGALPARPSSTASLSALATEVLRTSSRPPMSISRQRTSRLSSTLRLLTTCVLFILRIASHLTPHNRKVNLVLPGPEQPLVDGIEQHFRKGISTSLL